MTNSPKRRPLMADRFMVHPGDQVIADKTVSKVQSRLKIARKFVLDETAIRHAGNVIRTIPELLFRESQFARAPFEVTYIEIPDFPLMWEIMSGKKPHDHCDPDIGFLIDHDEAFVICGNNLMPVSYLLKMPWPESERKQFGERIGFTPLETEAFLWGSTFNEIGGLDARYIYDNNHPQAALRNAHACRILPLRHEYPPKLLGGLVAGGIGELKILISLLLLLNRPTLTTYVRDLPHFRGFVGNKMRSYFSHTVVTINLDPKPTLRMLGTLLGESGVRRRHEVRGTWCRNYDAREYEKIGCIHEWMADPEYATSDDPDDPDHWVCEVCAGKRWWRSEMTRGDASKGFVQKDYNIKARTNEARRRYG